MERYDIGGLSLIGIPMNLIADIMGPAVIAGHALELMIDESMTLYEGYIKLARMIKSQKENGNEDFEEFSARQCAMMAIRMLRVASHTPRIAGEVKDNEDAAMARDLAEQMMDEKIEAITREFDLDAEASC